MLRRFIKTACNTVIITLAFLVIASMSSAEVETGLFLGGSIGQSFLKTNFSDEDSQFDEKNLSYRFFIGWRPIRFLTVEAGYRDFGKLEDKLDGERVTSKTTAFDMFVVPMIPIGPIDLFAKSGAAKWNADSSLGNNNQDEDGTDFIWGAGIALRIKSLSIRLEWEELESDYHARLGMVSTGLSYTF
jgi:hypothetical protein